MRNIGISAHIVRVCLYAYTHACVHPCVYVCTCVVQVLSIVKAVRLVMTWPLIALNIVTILFKLILG